MGATPGSSAVGTPRSSTPRGFAGNTPNYSPNGHSAPVAVLSTSESHSARIEINLLRARLSGTNQKPLPAGNVTNYADGRRGLATADGRHYELGADGRLVSYRAQDETAKFLASGRVASLHTSSIDIRSGPHGERTITWRQPDQSVVVRTGRHFGYVQRPVTIAGNLNVVQRTYWHEGLVYTRVYTPYNYRGVVLLRYVPDVYYAPGFYGWVYYPWRPRAFDFGVAQAPWYAAEHNYFSPSPSYASGYSWLADFAVVDVLARDFEQKVQADPAEAADIAAPTPVNRLVAAADTPINSEVKDAIAAEVREQLAMTNVTASGSSGKGEIERTEGPDSQIDRVFVVSSLLEVDAREGQSCSLSGGDILQMASPPEKEGDGARVRVTTSKRDDCPVGEIVAVSLPDLQEMQNELRAEINAGLKALHDNQGREGWPNAPASALSAAPRAVLPSAPPADGRAGELLAKQEGEANRAEAGLVAAALAGN